MTHLGNGLYSSTVEIEIRRKTEGEGCVGECGHLAVKSCIYLFNKCLLSGYQLQALSGCMGYASGENRQTLLLWSLDL